MDTETMTRDQEAAVEELGREYDQVRVTPLWSGHAHLIATAPGKMAQRIIDREGEEARESYDGACRLRALAVLDTVSDAPTTESARRRLLEFVGEASAPWADLSVEGWSLGLATRQITVHGGTVVARKGEPVLVDVERPARFYRIVGMREPLLRVVSESVSIERTVAPTVEDEAAAEREEARGVDCPVCVSKAGEDCCPVSLDRPHRARLEKARGDTA